MATISDATSIQATLTTTTVDLAQITQFWDALEVTNLDATNPLYVTFNGATPTAGGEGTFIVPPSVAKTFTVGIINEDGISGSTTAATCCHVVRVLGNGGSYAVEGA